MFFPREKDEAMDEEAIANRWMHLRWFTLITLVFASLIAYQLIFKKARGRIGYIDLLYWDPELVSLAGMVLLPILMPIIVQCLAYFFVRKRDLSLIHFMGHGQSAKALFEETGTTPLTPTVLVAESHKRTLYLARCALLFLLIDLFLIFLVFFFFVPSNRAEKFWDLVAPDHFWWRIALLPITGTCLVIGSLRSTRTYAYRLLLAKTIYLRQGSFLHIFAAKPHIRLAVLLPFVWFLTCGWLPDIHGGYSDVFGSPGLDALLLLLAISYLFFSIFETKSESMLAKMIEADVYALMKVE